MAKIISPQIITKDGECKIQLTIDLNININQPNAPIEAVFSTQNVEKKEIKKEVKEEDENNWIIPDFGNLKKIDFGQEG
jgi:hypothetical protein